MRASAAVEILPMKLELSSCFVLPTCLGMEGVLGLGETALALETEARILSSLVLAPEPRENSRASASLDFLRAQ